MRSNRDFARRTLPLYAFLTVASWAGSATAQVREVVVGITPTCPYGLTACWAGAYEALGRMEGVESVEKTPNAYTCSAEVHMKGGGLPDPDRWASQFKAMVDQAYHFRGVEVTVSGDVERAENGLVMRVPGVEKPIALGPLRQKIQLNPKKRVIRQPEPDERDAYEQVMSKVKADDKSGRKVQVTGPLTKSDKGYALEIREFFPRSEEAQTPPKE